jgi:hypothetical protein
MPSAKSPRRLRVHAERAAFIWGEIVADHEDSWPPPPVEMATALLALAAELRAHIPPNERAALQAVSAQYRDELSAHEALILDTLAAHLVARMRCLQGRLV